VRLALELHVVFVRLVLFCSEYIGAYESNSDGVGEEDDDEDISNHVTASSVRKLSALGAGDA